MSRELDSCHRIFAEIEAQRLETIAELSEWSPHHVGFRPAAGTWSAIEVLDHIVKAETGTIAQVRVGLRCPHILGMEERPGVALLDRALRSEQKFQVPPGAADIYPEAEITFPEVAQRWEQTRVAVRLLLQELADDDTYCGVFCHPFAEWMTFAEVLDHFSAHLYHHRFQLARLRMSSAFLDLDHTS